MGNLNPKIREFEVGARETRTIKIYPLSIADQLKMGDIIVTAITDARVAAAKYTEETKGMTGEEIINARLNQMSAIGDFMRLIEDNLAKILGVASDVPAEEIGNVVNDMTNEQLYDIVDHIWTVNYEEVRKNGLNLFQRVRGLTPKE
jgi:hypothetical protein